MASTGKWETVVNKKKSQVTKSDVKRAQQKFIDGEKTPKMEARDPIKLDQTVYAAGFESKKFNESESDDEQKYPSRIPYNPAKNDNDLSSSSPKDAKRKEKKINKQVPIADMTEKINKISHDVLLAKITEVQNKFPNSQLIWLKEIADWLHLQLPGPSEKKDIAFINKKKDYPLCDVTTKVKSSLVDLMAACDNNVLNSFFTFLIASLVSEVQLGHSTVADRLLIQILCDVSPDIVANNCNEAVSSKSRNSDSYVAVIWALSQGQSTLQNGFEVWWSAMYSTLDKKPHAVASMDYLFQLLNSPDMSKIKSPIIKPDEMLQLIDLMVSTNSVLRHTPTLMESLESHWNELCKLLLGNGSRDQGKMVFSNILPKLRSQEDESVSEKVCELLLKCILSSRDSLVWWEDNFIHHMKESSVLLKYIQAKSNNISDQIDRCHRSKKVLYYSIQGILERLEKANERGRFEKKSGYKDCRKLCLAYIRHEESRKSECSKVWSLMKFAILLLLAVLAYDLYAHKGYKGSVTSVYMKQYGIETRAFVAFEKSQQLSNHVVDYFGTHVPYYYSKVSIYVEPALEVTWEYVTMVTQFMYQHSEPLRLYANQYIPPLLEKISSFISEQYRIISTFFVTMFNHYVPILQKGCSDACNWLSENIPLAYHYIVSLLVTIQQKIYETSPEMFDQMSVVINDAWKYLLKTTPVVMETVENYASRCLVTGREYVQQGQTWFQRSILSNASPASTVK